MVEHVHPYVDDEHDITCPYCGSPLYAWREETGDVEWEELHNGCFMYKEACQQCERPVAYRLNFTVTCAVVVEERLDR